MAQNCALFVQSEQRSTIIQYFHAGQNADQTINYFGCPKSTVHVIVDIYVSVKEARLNIVQWKIYDGERKLWKNFFSL